jgi:succinate dehydrogenase/fumarate reductase flavoprotein subunit
LPIGKDAVSQSGADQSQPSTPLRAADVPRWDREHDVVIVGHGAAGGAAAIEAARAGADTLVLERMSRGGGAAALSTGLIYFGGGTAIQRSCGFEDSVEEMRTYVELAAGRGADPERIRLYCEHSVEHFEWLRALGVEYRESYYASKSTHPLTDDCLMYTGNEESWPFCERTRPVPRGHKPAREGEAGGYLMEAILRGGEAAGARVLGDCPVERLIRDERGRVVGVAALHEQREIFVQARRGVLLAAGGFISNKDMLARHAPDLLSCNYEVGTVGDDGRGIRMGMGAGAEAINMSEGLVLNAYYPPESHLKGVFVNGSGQRFINEDAYIGRTGDAMLRRAQGNVYLIVDDEIYGRTQAMHRLAAVEETFADLERALEMPYGALVATLESYNAWAARGEDPIHHKAAKWLRPLCAPPYAALDCRVGKSIYGGLTLGGLSCLASGEALDPDGVPIPGLYTAGRNSAGLCREGRTYASGLSIGDATYFGRLAGLRMAAAEPWVREP